MYNNGNCTTRAKIAQSRSVAAAKTSARVMEVGVQELATKIDSSINTNLPWGEIQKKLDANLRDPAYMGSKKVEYSELSAYLTHVRRAWRNETMHPKVTYIEEDARDVLAQVRLFMNHLAVTL
jgi:hypothetical protein